MTLGYEKNPSAGSVDNAILVGIDSAKETILHIFIALEPPLLQPSNLKISVASDEEEYLLRYAQQWHRSHPFPKRYNATTAIDMTGNSVFITKYLRPQLPPAGISTTHQILRFVSMLPFLSSRTAFGGHNGSWQLWATTAQTLDIGAGDSIEHAVLLWNLLAASGRTAFVVLGDGFPDGRCAYVLVEDEYSLAETVMASSGSTSSAVLLGRSHAQNLNVVDAQSGSSLDMDVLGRSGDQEKALVTLPKSQFGFFSRLPNFPFFKNSEKIEKMGQENVQSSGSAILNQDKIWRLLHPVLGEMYQLNDPYCPLKEVGCAFNSENVCSELDT
ncbi:Coiled-coil and C2 domain-containing protein 2A [Nowakowskiella sp. JEL0078]|nr:Coiled-coil and C2 domain-containing protein 2A [Nowakowskiella sp. JEL0078]